MISMKMYYFQSPNNLLVSVYGLYGPVLFGLL